MRSRDRYPSSSLLARTIFYALFAGIAIAVFVVVLRLPIRGGRANPGPNGTAAQPEADPSAECLVKPERVALVSLDGKTVSLTEGRGIDHEPASLCEETRGVVKRRDTVSDLLLRCGFSHEVVHAVNQAARPVFDLRKIRAGQPYSLAKADTAFCHFTYEIDPEHYLLIAARGPGLFSEIREYPFQTHIDSIVGTITNSLFQSVLEIGEGPELAIGLGEIFAWDIDFFLDIRKGDQFKVFFERKCLEDSMVCYGGILAAEFIVQGKPHQAFYFCNGEGYDDYYNAEGGSLRRALLKAPLRYTRISSNFSRRRFHPVRRHYAPHLGIDYAAPIGTPVRATGDGTVIFAARSGANGNMVQIRHNDTYITYYLHLSKFGKGIKKGAHVKQGDVIGHVGSTGVSTGPHLDYRIKKHGEFIDPRKVDLPAADPVAAVYRSEFESLRDDWLYRIKKLGGEPEDELALAPSARVQSHKP